jgi:hypothetical protein
VRAETRRAGNGNDVIGPYRCGLEGEQGMRLRGGEGYNNKIFRGQRCPFLFGRTRQLLDAVISHSQRKKHKER